MSRIDPYRGPQYQANKLSNLREQIESGIGQALVSLLGPEGAGVDPVVRPTQDIKFGDYQSNVALGLARRLGKKPREIAEELVRMLNLDSMLETPEIAGPGFINLRIRPQYLAAQLEEIQADPRLGVPVSQPVRIVVDFSSPNLAKEMHVGHLRSTIIGDAIARLLEFQGHDVLRLNHVGDWGTQFGMLLQYVCVTQPDVLEHPERFQIEDLEEFYRAAKARFDSDEEFAQAARRAVVDLQSGDSVAGKLWEAFVHESLRHCHAIYRSLLIEIIDRGESFYNPLLAEVVEELLQREIAVEDQGAVCVFLDGWINREGEPLPMIIRKSDGGYNYGTTDLAGIVHRTRAEHARRIIYVTDIRQAQHFKMVFQLASAAGWITPEVSVEHVGFGMVLGPDRLPFKTRSGGTIKLKELLDEAESRALAVIEDRENSRLSADVEQDGEPSPSLPQDQLRETAHVVGIGAVKYFDLSHNLASDYVFDWDTMLNLKGNTAVYMIYAYARVRSIGRRAGVDFEALPRDLPLYLEHPSEIGLSKQLLLFPSVIDQVAADLRPHLMTDYLYDLSRAFSTFYDRDRGVRVIDAETQETRLSRLRLCDMTARTLQLGLGILGIQVLEQL